MPSAVAEAEAVAMDNVVDVWRLNTASRLQKEIFMLRRICNYFRGCWCKHEFELLAQVTEHDVLMGTSHHNTYRCKRCGYVQRVRL
jgi:hypothetical protein